jgi:undecaprenyl-diphosphatase
MLEQILGWDTSLFIFLNGLGSPSFDLFWMIMTNKAVNGLLYLGLLIWFYRMKGGKEALFLLLSVGVLILVTDQVTNLFKYGFERLRPCHTPEIQNVMRLVKKGCGGMYGYFSGHASNSFALATYFSMIFSARFSKIQYLLFFIAALIAYSRVYIGVHFPIDIISGALFGSLWAFVFFKLSSRIYERFSPNDALKL